jgi:FMN-dependent oxidoreductase (nitrilotriacetate monooxygenase family)
VVTTGDPGAAHNFGFEQHPAHNERYQRAAEFVEVATALWDSWADDAIVLDRSAGIQTDRRRIRAINHDGKFFKVAGPLNIPRSPQGHPVLAHAGQSPDGLQVAAHYAELLFGVQHDIAAAQAFVRDMDSRLAAVGRPAGSCKILPGLLPIIGNTEAEALRLEAELHELGGQTDVVSDVSKFIAIDLTQLDPDQPIDLSNAVSPENFRGPQSWFRQVFAEIQQGRLSVRALRAKYRSIGRSGHLQAVGTPEQVADTMERWFIAGACHGFTVMPTTAPQSALDFLQQVVPLLAARGLFRQEYEGPTLRDHLGLPRPPGPGVVP